MQVDRDELKLALGQSKMEVVMRGHAWDVADVMEVLDGFFDLPATGAGGGHAQGSMDPQPA